MKKALNVEGLTGFQRGKKYSFADRPVLFGTGDTCDVRFDPVWDKTVSAQHATVRFEKGDWILEDRSQQGTFIAGRRVVREALPGDCTMELGKGGPKIKLSMAGPAASPASGGRGASVSAGGSTSLRWAAVGVGVIILAASAFGVNAWLRSRTPAGPKVTTESPRAALPNAPAPAPVRTDGDLPANSTAQAKPAAPAVSPLSPTPSAPAAMPKWDLVVDMGEEIFPSFIIASATVKESWFDELNKTPDRLGDIRGAIGIAIASPTPGTKMHVEIKENEYMHGSTLDEELPKGGVVYRVYPSINYRFDALTKVRQTIPLTLTAEVTIDGMHAQKTKTVRVASINECPYALVLDQKLGTGIRMDWMFAAYVNENHPIADELRKEALKSGVIKKFVGYQLGEEEVYQQVFAIWNALQRRGVSYSSITTTPGKEGAIASQSVRFIDQSINNSQANCVDGSVLFASVLRQIGIDAILVMPPGHCFLGFFVDEKRTKIDYLETTRLGLRNPKPSRSGAPGRRSAKLSAIGAIEEMAPVESILMPTANFAPPTHESLELFTSAIGRARDEVRESDPNLVSISTARAMGVLPIGYAP
jgi:hypothetical protein